MSWFSKNLYTWTTVFLLVGSLYVISCSRNKEKPLRADHRQPENIALKTDEEEVKYFFVGGEYDISIKNLSDYENNWYDEDNLVTIDPYDLEDWNIVDPEGNLVYAEDLFEVVNTEDGPMFKKTRDMTGYKLINEVYRLGRSHKLYCPKVDTDDKLEDLIFDDKLLVRLYDKNNKIISENKMRRAKSYDNFSYNFAPKIKPEGTTEVWLLGMLKLPPKSERDSLKYRVVRLDESGNPKPYLISDREPNEYYHWEESLESYSEYSTWNYHEKSGCYTKSYFPQINCPPDFLCSY